MVVNADVLGCTVSTKGIPIHILLVGLPESECWLRGLLALNNSNQLCVTRVSHLESAVEYMSREDADVLLLDLRSNQSADHVSFDAVRAAMLGVPFIILSETHDESLAVKLLQQGAQDFLEKSRLDGALLARSLRFAIERHRLQKTLQALSLQDDLTGLNNRRGFLMLAEQHLRTILRKGAALLVYMDVDDLKGINDTYGHLEGNQMLVATANVLRACFRRSDIIARMGGDEFCVLMTDACQHTAQKVRRRLQERLDCTNSHSTRGYLSLSVGIVDVPVVRQPALDDLLHLADSLMYEQKRIRQDSLPASGTHHMLV